MRSKFMNQTENNSIQILCNYAAQLLDQAHELVEQLERQNHSNFEFGKSVGPHFRHLLDHYQALLRGLENTDVIDYDNRHRDIQIQTNPQAAKNQMRILRDTLKGLANGMPQVYAADHRVFTVFKSGLQGEFEFKSTSTLARELVFISHHAVHHFALVRQQCAAAGLNLDPDFGKAPSTVAYERQIENTCA